jgi:GNAT superfamily N-acetyltransferase
MAHQEERSSDDSADIETDLVALSDQSLDETLAANGAHLITDLTRTLEHASYTPDHEGAPAVTGASSEHPTTSSIVRIVRADPGDAGVLTDVIAAAFFEIAPCLWLFPDPGERRWLLPRLLRLHLDDAFRYGAVHTTEDRAAVALWLPRDEGRHQQQGEDARLDEALGEEHAERVRRYGQLVQAAHPTQPHDYLLVAAVRPERRRRGIGSLLLAARHQHLDLDGRAAYLEASDPGTRQFYLALGYLDMDPPHIVLPGREPMALHRMWRPPGWVPALGERVTVRPWVSDWAGSTGEVTEVARWVDRPVNVVMEDPGGAPYDKRFALRELLPAQPATAS